MYLKLSTHIKPTFYVGNNPLKTFLKLQTRHCSFLHVTTFTPILLFLLAASSSSLAADDDYLRSLEAESNNSRNTTTNTSKPGNNYLDALSAEAESSASISTNTQRDDTYNKQLKKMERLLKTNKPSTYKFYKKLSKEKKIRIFEHYAVDKSDADTRLSHLKKQVMDAYFNK